MSEIALAISVSPSKNATAGGTAGTHSANAKSPLIGFVTFVRQKATGNQMAYAIIVNHCEEH